MFKSVTSSHITINQCKKKKLSLYTHKYRFLGTSCYLASSVLTNNLEMFDLLYM